MTWIRTIPLADASPELRRAIEAQRALFPIEYATPVHPTPDGTAMIVAAHSLIPEALHHAFSAFGVLMAPDLPLSRAQHEMIATMVSVTNRCRYCARSHAEFLRRITLDEALVAALESDYRSAPISEPEKVMLEYVVTLTKESDSIGPAHHERLRAAGFDDRAILQITLIAAWFSYINRVANGLGVGQ